MAIALEYKPLVAWRTFAMNVRLQQKETEENPAEYRLKVSPVDRHDLEAGTVDNECYFISFMGNPYTVINTGVNYIDVRDDFRVGTAPTAAKIGIVYKSVDNSPFIAPIFYRYLHKTALDNMRKIELSIVWQYANLLNNGWTPKGIIFEFNPETGFLSHTAGQLNVANWYSQKPEKRLDPGTAIDTTPVHKAFTVAANSFEILEPDAYFIYALFPVDKNVSTVQFQVSKQYWREKMFNGFICVLVGILNSEEDNRELVLDWSRTGKDGKTVEFSVQTGNFCWRYVGTELWNILFPVPQDGDPGAPGAPGADGITPHIGVNGNWYIGETDTGVAAQGPAGTNGVQPIVVSGLTLTVANWALNAGFYEYNLANVNITVNSIVEIIPARSTIDIVKAADIMPEATVTAGNVKLYAKNAPSGNISITITITESQP